MTPPSSRSLATSYTSAIRKRVVKKLVLESPKCSATKSQRRNKKGTGVAIQAHAVDWTDVRSVRVGLLLNFSNYSETDVDNINYVSVLDKLTLLYTQKQLLGAFLSVCSEKGVNMKIIDIDTNFASKTKSQRIFIVTCTKDIGGEEETRYDESK